MRHSAEKKIYIQTKEEANKSWLLARNKQKPNTNQYNECVEMPQMDIV